MREFLYHYEIKSIVKIYDGDTVKCWVIKDEGRHEFETLRLLDINTPEINSRTQHEAAVMARDYVIKRIGETFITGESLIYKGNKRDSFGRVLANIFIGYTNLNQELLDLGLATVYDGSRQVLYL